MDYRVCYADTDRMGRVYYANYLVWCERARTELMRAAGMAYVEMEQRGFFLPVRRCEVRYHGYAEYDENVLLCTWISRLRHATVTFETAVVNRQAEQLLVLGKVELACISAQGKPIPLPDDAVSLLGNFVVA
jgi:acyl-CoA thioester hydrolase